MNKYKKGEADICPKCKNSDVSIQYCAGRITGEICLAAFKKPKYSSDVYDNEHFHRYCRTCIYEWIEEIEKDVV